MTPNFQKELFKRNYEILGNDLTFSNISEEERTKHVHKLHPFLGKYIPQLVDVFLEKFFKKGQIIIDPFSGSGTTLIESNLYEINSIGIELSFFNILIQQVKLQKYNLQELEFEVKDALRRTEILSNLAFSENKDNNVKIKEIQTENQFLLNWYAKRSLQEMLFYREIIPDYKNQNVLKLILSRSARSARLITHFDLARPLKPVKTKYWCKKHNRYCEPVNEALKFIKEYSIDTIKRILIFSRQRTNAFIKLYCADSRTIKLPNDLLFDGIITSPPYIGLINYHEQHRYAYELLNFPRFDNLEIGSVNNNLQDSINQYKKDLLKVFLNLNPNLKRKSKIFIIVNDKYRIFDEIGKKCGFILKDIFYRPVIMKTDQNTKNYSECIYYFEKQ